MDAPTGENVVQSIETAGICKICLKQSSRYTCPRCNIPYCTLSCYRGKEHANCSETFYKENFLQALRETKGSSDDKKKVLEMLKRVEEENQELDSDDDSEDVADSLEKRLADLDLDQDADLVWERLTEKEKLEFEDVLKAGALGELLDTWTPWWTHHEKNLIVDLLPQPLVETVAGSNETKCTAHEVMQLSKAESTTQAPGCQCPKVLKKIPKLNDLLKSGRPSDLVVYNLANVLYCYAYIARLHNGAHFDLPLQATQTMLDLSQVLSSNHNFSSTEEAVTSAITNILQNPAYFSTNLLTVSILQDVVHILLGQSKDAPLLYTLAALSDLHRLLGTAKKHIEKESLQSKKPNQDAHSKRNASQNNQEHQVKLKRTIFKCRKKVEFLLSWTRKCGKFLGPAAAELQLLYKSRLASEEQYSQQQAMLEKAWGGPKPPKPKGKLIQEL